MVEGGDFARVEDDDVAFSVALCGEIHRLYSLYQNDDLSTSTQLRTGLDLARRMAVRLQSDVTTGMPAMRLQVAEAQAREMVALMFGDQKAGRAPTLPSPRAGVWIETAEAAIESASAPPSTPHAVPETSRSTGLSQLPALFWYRRSPGWRFVVGLIGCLVAGVLIDVPLAVMALFSNHLTEIGAGYAVFAIMYWFWRRKKTLSRLRGTRAGELSQGALNRESASIPAGANPFDFAESPVEAA